MKLALIDGDVLAYGAFVPRWQGPNDNKEMVIHLNSDGKRVVEELSAEEAADYIQDSWVKFQKDLEILVDAVYADDFLMAVKGDDNYRYLIYPSYKMAGKRSAGSVGQFVPTIRRMAVMEGLAIQADGREADDLLSIWAHQCRKSEVEYTVCTIDKDLRCIPGTYYNMKKKTSEEISEIEALRFHYAQILSGDPTDSIPGIPRVGPVKANKMLAGLDREEDMQEVVVAGYLEFYGENDWYSYLLSNLKLIGLQKAPSDYFPIKDWKIVQELI